MRYIVFLLCLVSLRLLGQPMVINGVKDSTTAFGYLVPKNSLVLDLSTSELWRVSDKQIATKKLSNVSKILINSQFDTTYLYSILNGKLDSVDASNFIYSTGGNNVMEQNLIITGGDTLILQGQFCENKTKIIGNLCSPGLVIMNDTGSTIFEMAYGQLTIKNPQYGSGNNLAISSTNVHGQISSSTDTIQIASKLKLSNIISATTPTTLYYNTSTKEVSYGAMVMPSYTTAERDLLSAVNGMIIYNTTTNVFNFYENGSWVAKP